jgi:hypothetical protein
MAKIAQALFLHLAGEPPPHLSLPVLRTPRSTFSILEKAFSSYLGKQVRWGYCDDVAQLPPNEAGLTLIYVMGHAWLKGTAFSAAVLDSSVTTEISGEQLIERLLPYLKEPAILVFDTCHAASIAPVLESSAFQRVAAIFGSSIDESALEFPLDNATRLAITLSRVITAFPSDAEVSTLANRVADAVHTDSAMAPQTVTYLPARPAIILSKGSFEKLRKHRSRTYIVVRGVLVSAGILVTCVIASLLWYWRSHEQVEVEVPKLTIVDGPLRLEVRRQVPDSNADELLETDDLLPGSTLRLRLPSDDLLFVVRGNYLDGRMRAIRFQL